MVRSLANGHASVMAHGLDGELGRVVHARIIRSPTATRVSFNCFLSKKNNLFRVDLIACINPHIVSGIPYSYNEG